MAKLINGTAIAETIRKELKEQINAWIAEGNRRPKIITILVGSNAGSKAYAKNIEKIAQEVGIDGNTNEFSSTITEENLLDEINNLNKDDAVDGILVQLPLPDHINTRKIGNSIACDKDVDGFNEINIGRLCLDIQTLIPCTPLGIQELLKRSEIKTFGKNAVVVSRSKIVGVPIAMLLHSDGKNDTNGMDATVTICHEFTPPEDLMRFCKLADIIVTATGIPGLIKANMIKPGACVIDVGFTGITDTETGRKIFVGDVDFNAVKEVAGYITPVPGGVGPMTVTMLMRNTFMAAKNIITKRNQYKN